MAGGHGGEVGCFARQNHSGSIGEGSWRRSAAISASCRQSFGPRQSFISQGLLEKVKAIADTGFLVAFGNRRDFYHEWAVHIARGVADPLLTCEAVLAETVFHLGDPLLVLGFITTGLVQPAFVLADHMPRIQELATRYRDRKPDLADLCLIRMSELYPKHPVVTTDLADFHAYRRNRREVIPLIFPPHHPGRSSRQPAP